MKDKRIYIILILMLILGLSLRIYKLGDESFWIDESATVYMTQQKAYEIINDIYTTTRHVPEYFDKGGTPPLYYVLANYWTGIVGLSEFKLRLLSAIFGIISIYMIFLIGKMLFDYRAGLVSAFILSINYLHINYSQEARTYSLVVLLTLLTVYFLLHGLKKQSVSYWIGYTISGALLIYTHYLAVFVLIAEYLYLLVFWKTYRDSLKKILFSGIGIFLLYVPWIPALLRQIADGGYLVEYLGKNIPYDLARIFVQFNSWFTPDLETRIALRDVYHSIGDYTKLNLFAVPILSWLTIISILLLTAFLAWFFIATVFIKGKRISFEKIKDKRYAFLLLWFLIPIVIPITITIISPRSPVFGFVQYVIFASPAYYLIVAKGILKSRRYIVLLILLVILSVLPLYSYYANFNKQQWREVGDYLKDNRELNELIIVNKANHVLSLGYYYDNLENVEGVENVEELLPKISGKEKFILVYASERYGDPKGELKNHLDSNFKLGKKSEFTGVKVFHYAR